MTSLFLPLALVLVTVWMLSAIHPTTAVAIADSNSAKNMEEARNVIRSAVAKILYTDMGPRWNTNGLGLLPYDVIVFLKADTENGRFLKICYPTVIFWRKIHPSGISRIHPGLPFWWISAGNWTRQLLNSKKKQNRKRPFLLWWQIEVKQSLRMISLYPDVKFKLIEQYIDVFISSSV